MSLRRQRRRWRAALRLPRVRGAMLRACAIVLESVAYCRYCASTLLGTTASPVGDAFELY